MTEDFAVLDFAVVRGAPATVAAAVARAWPDAVPPAPRPTGGDRPVGLLGRLMKRRDAEPAAVRTALTLHPASLLPPPPYARTDLASPGLATSGLRISAASGNNGMTLIELLEDLDGDAALCRALSQQMPGAELFFFRYSGSLHPGAHYAFHVYRDGRALRRASSISLSGDHSEAPWKATDSGMPHPAEADSLPAPATPAAEIMTPERQGSILAALGLDPDALFADMANRAEVIVLSPAAGGAPLSELEAAASAADLRRPAAFAATGPASPRKPAPEPQPQEAAPESAPSAPPKAPPEAPPEAPPALDALSPFGPEDPLPEDPDAWEQEVTYLLLSSVQAALPEAECIPWLERFTAQLDASRIDAALDRAARMIDTAPHPKPERDRAIARLRLLYAHLAAPAQPRAPD